MTNRTLTPARRSAMTRVHDRASSPHVAECSDRLAAWRGGSQALAPMRADGARPAHASTAGDAMT